MKAVKSKLSFLAITAISIGCLGIASCKKSSDSGTKPPVLIGGYASSDSVASSSLVAYWPFDGNANDTKGGASGTASSSVTYTTGVRGQAYQGAANGYATATPSSAFSNLPSYSLSVWYFLPQQPADGDPGGMFFLSGTNTGSELILETEHYTPVSGDSVKIHHGFTDLGSPAYQGFTMEAYDTNAIGKWVHLVMTYDGGSSVYTIYQNGVPTGNNSAFGQNITPTNMWTDGSKTTPLGNLSFSTDPPTQIVIGTWPVGLYGVSPTTLGGNGCYLGKLDELRVFNKALTQTEVAGLFLNGQAGR